VLSDQGTYVWVGHDHYGAGAGRTLGNLPRAFKLIASSAFVRQLPKPDFSPRARSPGRRRLW